MLHYTMLRLHTHAQQLFVVVVANDVQRICEVVFPINTGIQLQTRPDLRNETKAISPKSKEICLWGHDQGFTGP